jgi:hypothetical protein
MAAMLVSTSTLFEYRLLDGTALHSAGNRPAAEFLIKKFPEMIDYTDNDMVTASGRAFVENKVQILKFLLKNGAQMTSGKNRRNIFDCDYYEEANEATIMVIINFCLEDNEPNLRKVYIYRLIYRSSLIITYLIIIIIEKYSGLMLKSSIARGINDDMIYVFQF